MVEIADECDDSVLAQLRSLLQSSVQQSTELIFVDKITESCDIILPVHIKTQIGADIDGVTAKAKRKLKGIGMYLFIKK